MRQDCHVQYEEGWRRMPHQINQNELSKPKEPAPAAHKNSQQAITSRKQRNSRKPPLGSTFVRGLIQH